MSCMSLNDVEPVSAADMIPRQLSPTPLSAEQGSSAREQSPGFNTSQQV